MPYKDKVKQKAYLKAYRIANKEKIKARCKVYHKAYYLANKNKITVRKTAQNKAYWKAYHLANPEKARINKRKRKALKRGNSHESYTGNYIFERDGWICQLCGQKINKRLKYPNPRSGSIDHIVPLSKGGNDSPMNVQATHLRCNVGKNAINKGQLRLFG